MAETVTRARYATAAKLAEATGFSARWFTLRAGEGKIPGAVQPNGPGGGWRFSLEAFWPWWHARIRAEEQWQASTGEELSGGDARNAAVGNSASRLKQRLSELRNADSRRG